VRGAVSRRGRAARPDGCIPARGGRGGSDLQKPGNLALPIQRTDAGSARSRTGTDVLRALLEQFRGGQDALASGGRSSGLRGCLRPSRTDACGGGLFRVLSAGGQGFRALVTNEADHASSLDWRGEGKWRGARPADSARRREDEVRDVAEYRPLGHGRKPAGHDGRTRAVSDGSIRYELISSKPRRLFISYRANRPGACRFSFCTSGRPRV